MIRETLADRTTLGVGGPARRVVMAASTEEMVASVVAADRAGDPLLVLGGGSNLVVGDAGFPGMVVGVDSRGVRVRERGRAVHVRAAAGEPWDDLVARCVAEGWIGLECLSGIPGRVGATPIQNVGAYGQEVAQRIESLRVYDRLRGAVADLAAADCGFDYRSSRLRGSGRFVVLEVSFRLHRTGSAVPSALPIHNSQLVHALGAGPGDRVPLAEVREAVLGLRRAKGMLLDPGDPDSRSAGSFFVNPVLTGEQLEQVQRRLAAGNAGHGAGSLPKSPLADGRVKVSAAWLIEQAGVQRGDHRGRAGISSKHVLALVNRGGACAREILDLAGEVQARVDARFGVSLAFEPTLVGIQP